ncbi:hypothetical protein GCM10022255_027200 [Dactylosporangium darangshiense]|uniref:Uncharacterized protein n=1 Tax=Dactylosporangium darangshiense TaxID=579108 RepID=A0ABP8D5U4_9ACTN
MPAGFELAEAEGEADAGAETSPDAGGAVDGSGLPLVLPCPDWWPGVPVTLQLASINAAAATAMSAVAAPSRWALRFRSITVETLHSWRCLGQKRDHIRRASDMLPADRNRAPNESDNAAQMRVDQRFHFFGNS